MRHRQPELQVGEEAGSQWEDSRLAALAKTDRAAFGRLYDRYVDLVFRYCYRRLLSREAAEDATSLTFTKALAAISGYREDGPSFRSWLFTIAHHTIVDELRRRPASTYVAITEIDREIVSSALGPEEIALGSDELREFRLLLEQLRPDSARIVELRMIGLDLAEIATVLGKNPGAVRVAYHRAMKRLKTLIDGQTEGRT